MERGGSVIVDLAIGSAGDYTPALAASQQQAAAWARSLRHDLSRARDEAASLRNERQLLRSEAEALGNQTSLLRQELQATHSQVWEKANRLAELEKAERLTRESLKKSEAEMAALLNSLSWRVTKPIRATAEFGRKKLGRSS